jgi:hypothetical protein
MFRFDPISPQIPDSKLELTTENANKAINARFIVLVRIILALPVENKKDKLFVT